MMSDANAATAFDLIKTEIVEKLTMAEQKDDAFFANVIDYLETGKLPAEKSQAERILYQIDDFFINDDQLFRLAKIRGKRLDKIQQRFEQLCIPKKYRLAIIQHYHDLSHDGYLKCYLSSKQKFFWHGAATDFRLFIENCQICQTIKSNLSKKLPMTSLPAPRVFETCHLDHHSLPVAYNGYKHVLIMSDPASGNVQLSPCKTQSAEETARLFFRDYISLYGLPRKTVADRGQSFLSVLFTTLAKIGIGCRVSRTSGFMPNTNSAAELVNRKIIKHIRAFCKPNENWVDMLPAICLSNRYLINTSTGVSPFYALHGEQMTLDIDWTLLDKLENLDHRHAAIHFAPHITAMRDIIQQNLQDVRDTTELKHNVDASPHNFKVGDKVYMKQENCPKIGDLKHSKAWVGPYVVIEVNNINI